MKYANYYSRLLLIAVVLSMVASCAFNRNRDTWNYDGSNAVPLADTQAYLPVRERDELGQLLPYVAKPNPYAELSGRIDKTAVTTYIDARRAFNAQKFDFAEQLLSKLCEEEPKLSGPWVMRGDIAVAQDKLELALQHYAAAIKVNSVNFNAYLRLAKLQRQLGYFHHAQNTYAKALALWPDGPELHLNLGVLYDVYLNMPLKAQAHIEAYQLLAQQSSAAEINGDALTWLEEIKQRTGVARTLTIIGADGKPEVVSNQGQSGDATLQHDDDDNAGNELVASKAPGE